MSGVNVIVPCYRYAHYLEACVGSVLAQPVAVRVLIIDDASPDSTAEVASALARRDERVAVLRHVHNRGHIATFNEGLDWASADYTLLLSADDMLTPNALPRAIAALEAHSAVGLAYGRVGRFTDTRQMPRAHPIGPTCRYEVVPGHKWLEGILRDPSDSLTSPEAVVRTCWYKQLGGYRPDLPHTGDQEMWLRIAAFADVAVLDADQAFYRVHGQNMHVRHFGNALHDLEHRLSAFNAFFGTCGKRLADRERLESVAFRGLGTLAVETAWGAFQDGDAETSRDLLHFAVELCPALKRTPMYRRARLMNLIGERAWGALRGKGWNGDARPAAPRAPHPPAPSPASGRGGHPHPPAPSPASGRGGGTTGRPGGNRDAGLKDLGRSSHL